MNDMEKAKRDIRKSGQKLCLQDYNLTEIPIKSHKYIELLQDITIENIPLERLPQTLKTLPYLRRLTLDNVNLDFGKASVLWELKNLEDLTLTNCRFTTLPNELRNLTKLVYLNLARNRLYSLPDILDKLPELLKLNIVENCLSELPKSISKCKELRILLAFKNRITTIPADITKCTKLEQINFSHNRIKAPYINTRKLKKLWVYHCKYQTEFSMQGAVTGRMSSKHPNPSNIAKTWERPT